jgi:hypothetical protein
MDAVTGISQGSMAFGVPVALVENDALLAAPERAASSDRDFGQPRKAGRAVLGGVERADLS